MIFQRDGRVEQVLSQNRTIDGVNGFLKSIYRKLQMIGRKYIEILLLSEMLTVNLNRKFIYLKQVLRQNTER